MRKKFRYKKTIRNQFVLITTLMLLITVALLWIANALLLDQVYTKNKKSGMKIIYDRIVNISDEFEFYEKNFLIDIGKLTDQYNISMLIVKPSMEPLVATSFDVEGLQYRLMHHIINYNKAVEFSEKCENIFFAENVIDDQTKTAKMEMWGKLESGNLFLISAANESIEESVKISNQFLAIIGIIVITISAIIVWCYSKRFTGPVLELAEISERITNLDFDAKYQGKTKNELAILGNNMNKLSDSLQSTICELKNANTQLQKDIKLSEVIDLQRQEFVSTVSHELKTPIALIQGYAEGLRDGICQNKEEINDYLDVILDEAGRMNKMVKSFMTLNELEQGIGGVELERFDIVQLINNYLNNTHILLMDNRVKIIKDMPEKLYVWGDEFKTEEVLMNYISNAIHHIKGIDKYIKVTVVKKENQVKIYIFNTGEHIEEEHINNLWEKFYKTDKARSREYGGSGVGLSIVKAIQENINQEYGVKNVEGGVAFWFTLESVN